jgi:hypothetical protein
MKKHLLKFFRQNNYTEKAKILYFLNLVYFLSLVGLWQNHVFYWTLTGFMWRHTLFFSCLKSKHFFLFNYVPHLFLLTCVKFHGKKIDNNNTLTCICLPSIFQKNNQTLSNDWPTYCQRRIYIVLCFFLCLVYPMLPVPLDCPLLIAPSVFSKRLFSHTDIIQHMWHLFYLTFLKSLRRFTTIHQILINLLRYSP